VAIFIHLNFNQMTFDLEQVSELIRARRSVFPRQFDRDNPISDSLVWQILENANWAPTHKLTEPWRFSVFTGEGLKSFARFQAEAYKNRAGDSFREDQYQKLLSNPLLASHIISLGMKRHADKNIPEMEELAAVACAVQNIYLSVTAAGLGGYWTTGGVTFYEEALEFFGLEPQDRLMGFFYLARVAVPSPPSKRSPVGEKTRWINF
jgi:nitroreductase